VHEASCPVIALLASEQPGYVRAAESFVEESIALHGLENVGGVPGTAAPHGCVRLSDANIRWLVKRIGAGVPVTIT
jgi:lipoprotein-anchoring transpeptidase ErfK/SrfK